MLLKIDASQVQDKERITNLSFEIMSPWPGQEITFSLADWSERMTIAPGEAGEWRKVTLSIPSEKLAFGEGIKVILSHVHSPKTQKVSKDERRLGLAVRGLQ